MTNQSLVSNQKRNDQHTDTPQLGQEESTKDMDGVGFSSSVLWLDNSLTHSTDPANFSQTAVTLAPNNSPDKMKQLFQWWFQEGCIGGETKILVHSEDPTARSLGYMDNARPHKKMEDVPPEATSTCSHFWKNKCRHGKRESIVNGQGNRTTPHYVAFTDTEGPIGDAAKNQVAINHTNTILDTKRLIG